MVRKRSMVRLAVYAGVLALVVPLYGATAAEDESADNAAEPRGALAGCRPAGAIEARQLPVQVPRRVCDLVGRTVTDAAGLQVEVPEPGYGVTLNVLTPTGHQVFGARTDADGVVHLENVGDEATAEPDEQPMAAAAVPNGCRDRAYKLLGYRETNRHRWYFNIGSRPRGMGRDAAIREVRRAHGNINNSRNPCGMADRNSSSSAYQGGTSRRANISRTQRRCLAGDGYSVVAFQDTVSNALALTCAYRRGGEVSSADIAINKGDFRWFTGRAPSGCRYRFSVVAITTHEVGHVFGLGHPSGSHPGLTMRSVGYACSRAQASLGRGDVRGLNALY